jgi:hypothetical protein
MLLLIGVGLVGALAIVGGTAMVQLGLRRSFGPRLAFTGAPPLGTPAATDPRAFDSSRTAPHHAAAPRQPRSWHRPSASTVLFVVAFAYFTAIAWLLAFHYGSLMGDAESRVADGWYVFFTRDPHLAAIGFVWNPLPSVLVMPFFAFKGVWPALTHRAFAGDLASAVFMALCAVELRRILRELNVSRFVTWAMIIIFLANPVIAFYGANGMTEAFYLYFLLVATRFLMRWLRSGGIVNLVVVGVALGLDYLVRYEALAAAGAVGLLVAVVSYRRASGARRARLERTGTDLVVYGLPPAAAFIGWAIVSYVITGHLFEQFSSIYGNSAQIASQGGIGVHYIKYSAPLLATLEVLAWSPLLPIAVLIGGWTAWRRRDLRLLALMPLAGTSGFSFLAMVTGQAGPNVRYFMPMLPLWLVCLGYASVRKRERPRRRDWLAWERRVAVVALALVVGSAGMVTTALAMDDPNFAVAEYGALDWNVYKGRAVNGVTEAQKEYLPSTVAITRQIDALHLRSGSIVTDTFTKCVSLMLMTSDNPHQFVVTSDRDFQRTLLDPVTFHAHYLLVPPGGGANSLDAVARAYPGLYVHGIPGAALVKQFHEPGCPAFRLYHVSLAFH